MSTIYLGKQRRYVLGNFNNGFTVVDKQAQISKGEQDTIEFTDPKLAEKVYTLLCGRYDELYQAVKNRSDALARCDGNGNDGADVYEVQECDKLIEEILKNFYIYLKEGVK